MAHSLIQRHILIREIVKNLGLNFDNLRADVPLVELERAIEQHFQQLGKKPEKIVCDYVERVNKLAVRGGFGHEFKYRISVILLPSRSLIHYNKSKFESPPHLIIKPKHYNESMPTRDEQIALDYVSMIYGPEFHCSISKEPIRSR